MGWETNGMVFATLKPVNKSIAIRIATVVLMGVSVVAFFLFNTPKQSIDNPTQQQEKQEQKQTGGPVRWEFDMQSKRWQAFDTPPDCPEPLLFPPPADVHLASGVLYPGQIRGGDYKAHGGFRFDTLENNAVDVYAPMDAYLVEAARHPSFGEVQYVLYFRDDCGIMYKLDHLRELTPKFTDILNTIPMGGENDSRSTQINPAVFTKKGEHIATKVGLESTKNVFFDFGVYDLRKTNGVNYASRDYYNIQQYGAYALCWLENIQEPEKNIVKKLPGADGQNGTTSDYCD